MTDKALPTPTPPSTGKSSMPQNQGGGLTPPPSKLTQARAPLSQGAGQVSGGQTMGQNVASSSGSAPPSAPSSQSLNQQPTPQQNQQQAPMGSAPPLVAPQAKTAPSQTGQAGQTSGAAVPPHLASSTTIQKPGEKQKNPKMAQIKKSPLKYLPIVIGGGIFVLVVLFAISRLLFGGSKPQSVQSEVQPPNSPTSQQTKPPPAKQITLTYWGLWEPEATLNSVLKEFEQNNPGVLVNYVKQSHRDYRERLQTAIASGRGPDTFRFHASWTPMLRNELAIIPADVMTTSEFQQEFFPAASFQLQIDGQYVGIPLMYDGLMLYYNKEAFETANVQPPRTWAELREIAVRLSIRSADGLERAGLAIGTANNVDHFSDILGLLMLQNGADLANPNSKQAQEALEFYTNFVKNDQVWDSRLPSSTIAFARGEVAMMFAPSWRAHEIMQINPALDFATAPVPKLGDTKVAWATYWAEGVNVQSEHQEEAWRLLSYMSSPEVLQKLYSQQSLVRAFGEPYSRRSMVEDLADAKYLGALYQDAPYATSWYLCSYTHDNGLNDLIIKYYEDAVNAVLGQGQSENVMQTLTQGTQQILRQYGAE